MQDGSNDLLHLTDLALGPEDTFRAENRGLDIVACTGQCLLADNDGIALSLELAPGEVQEWCLLRIAKYQHRNRLLRERYGAAARNEISKTKTHIRALRSAYNDAAPINRHLPPEVLMEVFSYVHPAVMPRPRLSVLRVCRYWRRLLFHTSQFWANILSSPTWKSWNPKYHLRRFEAAMARSAPHSLTLSIPYCHAGVASILESHAIRLSSLKVGPTLCSLESVAQVLKQRMPLLTHLAILHQHSWHRNACKFSLNLPDYPNLQTLEFEDTCFYTPVAPYPSLCHLKLKCCTIRPPPTAGGTSVHAVCTMHNALGLFPNLETLSMVYSLSDADPGGLLGRLPELTETIHLPRLRHLELVDIPAYIPLFLSHLIFPATTSLVLEPAYLRDYFRRSPAAPLFPGINPFPTPTAELSLCLYSRPRIHNSEHIARWETHGDGVRPIRVTFPSAENRTHNAALVARFSRELAAALAPAPAPGVTSLTVQPGAEAYLSPGEWMQLMRELPGLRTLRACDARWTTAGTLIDVLGDSAPGGEFVCTRLTDVVLPWRIPYEACSGEGGELEGEWEALQQQDGTCATVGPHDKPAEGSHPEAWLAASLSKFCDTLRTCFTERAGRCKPIRKLSVSPSWGRYCSSDRVLEGWQAALVERRLRRALGYLVGEIAVSTTELIS